MDKKLIGKLGEKLVCKWYTDRKYKLLAVNYHTRFGEIDIIAKNKTHIVFIEVKTRADSSFAQAREFVDRPKQDRLRTTAAVYLSQNPTELQPRFDVIEIYAPNGVETRHPVINHLEDAFQ